MSQTQERTAYDCAHCGGPRTKAGIEGSYCSWDCVYRARGESLLAVVEADSRFCNTCYGRVRDIEPVPDDSKTTDGLQYRTPRQTRGVDEREAPDGLRVRFTRISCVCGAVDPTETHADLQNVDLSGTVARLYRALVACYRREAIDHEPDRERYVEAVGKTRDARYVAGYAVFGED